MIKITARRMKSPAGTFQIPIPYEIEGEYFNVTIDKPHKPRSTGPGSQNHKLNGIIQMVCKETGNDFDTVKGYVKHQAMAMGYPFDTIGGVAVPWSEARSSVDQCSLLIQAALQLAAELGIVGEV